MTIQRLNVSDYYRQTPDTCQPLICDFAGVIVDAVDVSVIKLVDAQRNAIGGGSGLLTTLKLSVLVLLLVKLESVLTQTLYSPPRLVGVIIATSWGRQLGRPHNADMPFMSTVAEHTLHEMLAPLPLTTNGVSFPDPTLVPSTQAAAWVGYPHVVRSVRQVLAAPGCAGPPFR